MSLEQLFSERSRYTQMSSVTASVQSIRNKFHSIRSLTTGIASAVSAMLYLGHLSIEFRALGLVVVELRVSRMATELLTELMGGKVCTVSPESKQSKRFEMEYVRQDLLINAGFCPRCQVLSFANIQSAMFG